MAGAPFVTGGFAVDTSDPHTPLPYTPPTPAKPQLDISSGDTRLIVSGQRSRLLMVSVKDQGNPVAGAHVSFEIGPCSPAATLEAHPTALTTTNASGVAAIACRPAPGATGQGTVIARIVGTTAPEATKTFHFTAVAPRLLLVNPPTTPLSYGAPTT